MKPVPFDRFLKAANKAYDLYKLKTSSAPKEPGFFFVHAEYREIKIFNEILYVEGLKDYVKIYMEKQQHPLLTRMNLKAIKQSCRKMSSRGSIIRLSYRFARSAPFQKSQVYIGSKEIPIGEKYAEEFRKRYVSN